MLGQVVPLGLEVPLISEPIIQIEEPTIVTTTGTTIRTGTVFGQEDALIEQRTGFETQAGAEAFLLQRFAELGQ